VSVLVRLESVGPITVVVAEGRLDFGACAAFQSQIEKALAAAGKPPAGVLIDCSWLDYVSSGGLRLFLVSARAARRASLEFALCALKPAVAEVFELSGFSRMIPVHPDRTAALAHMP
jgi:anti-anti-sigma factor